MPEVMGVPCINSDGFCHAQRTIRTPLHPLKLRFPFKRTMRPTLLIRARFQLAVPVLLAIVPIISATSSPRATGPTIVQQFDKWDFIGCYEDSNDARTLGKKIADGLITVEYCLEACKDGVNTYGGMEFGKECWCGNAIYHGRKRIDPSKVSAECNYACHGNGAQICGGEHHLVLYGYTGVYPSTI